MSKWNPYQIQNDLEWLYPPFRAKVEAVVAQATREVKALGLQEDFARFTVYETYRSPERQLRLYERGRTRPGSIVTNLKSGSLHEYGLAADLLWVDRSGRLHWDGNPALWARLGHVARAHGLVWGGDWKTLKDFTHIQPSLKWRLLWKIPAKLHVAHLRKRLLGETGG